MTDKPETPVAGDWQEPLRDDDGTYLAGASGLPANHRLRAEALVRARKASDPDGLITPELIADTATRLRAEDKAAKAAQPVQAQPAGEGE